MVFLPIEYYKGDLTRVAETPEESVWLAFNGWRVAGTLPPPAPPSSGPGGSIDLFANRTGPLYVAHRLGGGRVAPDGSMYAANLTSRSFDAVLECDAQALADGTLGIMHDPTVNRTTSSTGDVDTFDALSWSQLRFKAMAQAPTTLFCGTAGIPLPDEAPPTWLDILDTWGGKRPILIESKDGTETANRIVADVKRRNLTRSVMMTSFDQADLEPAVRAGMPTMWNSNSPTAALVKNKGITYVSVTLGSMTQALVDEMHGAGCKVAVYTVNSRVDRDAMLALGADCIVTEEPFYTPLNYGRRTDPWKSGQAANGQFLVRGTGALSYKPAQGQFGWEQTAGDTHVVLGWAGPILSSSYKVRFQINYPAGATADSAFGGLYVAMANDRGIAENNGTNTYGTGYKAIFRRNGFAQIYKVTAGVGTSIGGPIWTTLGLPPFCADSASAGTAYVEVEVNTSGVVVRRYTANWAALEGVESLKADTAYRGPYIGITHGSGGGAFFSNMTITPL